MASPIFLVDTFQNASGSDAALDGHTSDNGATWTITLGGAGAFTITPSNWLRLNINGQAIAHESISMAGSQVLVTYDVIRRSSLSDFFDLIIGQFYLRNNNGSGGIQLLDNTGTQLVATGVVFSAGTPQHIEFFCSQTSQVLTVNGVQAFSIAHTGLTVSGQIGFQADPGGGAEPTDTTGLQITNLYAYNNASLNIIAPDNSDIVLSPGNQWVNPATSLEWIHTATSAKFDFTGTSATVQFNLSSLAIASRPLSEYPTLNWSIDGAVWQRRQIESSMFPLGFNLSGGSPHSCEIRYEANNLPGGITLDLWTPIDAVLVTGWVLDSGATISAPTGNAAQRSNTAMVFGDSIVFGFYSGWAPGDLPGSTNYSAAKVTHAAFGVVLGQLLDAEVGLVGYPGQGYVFTGSFAETLPTTYDNYESTNIRSWPANLTYAIICESTNDSTVSSSTLQTAIVGFMVAIRSKTNAVLVMVPAYSASLETSDSVLMSTVFANAVAAYKSAHPNDPKVLIANANFDVNNTDAGLLTPNPYSQYTYDSVHPTSEGHMIVAARIASAIQYFEGSFVGTTVTTF